MALEPHEYIGRDVYRTISDRFRERHGIKIDDHIHVMKEVGHKVGVGITFVPVDHRSLKSALRQPLFTHDDRRHLCDALAALATTGEGYREVGVPSLHCQISGAECNIHLDDFGFVAIGPDGRKYYNPDLVQHIVDELGWATVANWVHGKSPTLGSFLGRMHPVLPNSRNRYAPVIGGRFVVAQGQGWSLGIDYQRLPGGESRKMGSLEVLSW